MATPATHTLIGFEKSHLPAKKYNAILERISTGAISRVPFGATGYEQYKDSTGLGIYSHLDHLDKSRRRNYISRHSKDNNRPFSASWLSLNYLW